MADYTVGQVVNPGTGEKIVQIVPDQSGQGSLALTNFGGVYTSGDAQLGSNDGGSYLGHVGGVSPAQRAAEMPGLGQGAGNFSQGSIVDTPAGYTLTNNAGQAYAFSSPYTPPTAPTPPGAMPAAPGMPANPAPTPFTSGEQSAWALISQTLESYGFSGADLNALQNFVQQQLISGASSDQITLQLEQTPQFASRFPAIVQRRQAGLPPISPSEYLSLEKSYNQLDQSAGLPPRISNYDALIGNDVSPAEYADRINKGYLAIAQADPTVVRAMHDYYGVSRGELAGYFLNPDVSAPLLEQRAVAAQVGGASAQSGFGRVTSQEAQRLAQMNVTFAQAQQGFAKLYEEHQLYSNLPGQGAQTQPSTDQLLNAQFGSDGRTQQYLQRQADIQKGFFNQGGQAAETSTGVQGLGVVQR
jgi:hypothetical protein